MQVLCSAFPSQETALSAALHDPAGVSLQKGAWPVLLEPTDPGLAFCEPEWLRLNSHQLLYFRPGIEVML